MTDCGALPAPCRAAILLACDGPTRAAWRLACRQGALDVQQATTSLSWPSSIAEQDLVLLELPCRLLAKLPRLQQLSCEGAAALVNIQGLAMLPDLRVLQLADCPRIRDISPLSRCAALTSLTLVNVGSATPAALARMLPSLANLQTFSLAAAACSGWAAPASSFGEQGAEGAEGEQSADADTPGQLGVICGQDCSSSCAEPDSAFMSAVGALSRLDCLRLSGAYLRPHELQAAPDALTRLTRLTCLVFVGGSVASAACASQLCRCVGNLRHLVDLDLCGLLYGATPVSHLAQALAQLTVLTQLGLCSNLMGAKGAATLGPGLAALGPRLLSLELATNVFRSKGVVALAPFLCQLSALRRLGLASNLVTDAGAEAMATVVRTLPRLAALDVRANRLTAAGVGLLAEAALLRCRGAPAGAGGEQALLLDAGEQCVG